MRSLNTRDLFKAIRVVKETGIKEAFKSNIGDFKNKSEKEIGIDLIFTVLESATEKNTEEQIYDFLSGPLEIKKEEVGNLDPIELADKILEIANIEKWKDFLSRAAQLKR